MGVVPSKSGLNPTKTRDSPILSWGLFIRGQHKASKQTHPVPESQNSSRRSIARVPSFSASRGSSCGRRTRSCGVPTGEGARGTLPKGGSTFPLFVPLSFPGVQPGENGKCPVWGEGYEHEQACWVHLPKE